MIQVHGPFAHSFFTNTNDNLENLGFNVEYDYTNNWITSYEGNVMGYSSYGTHAEDGNCNFHDSAWVKDSLDFNLSNGAIFNVLESFNGQSLTTLNWRFNEADDCSGHTMGLATQWTEIGGTGMMAHGWEPYFSPLGVIDNRITFPAYAIGYNMIDAIYQGMKYLAWVNVVVGDPLTTIAWGKQTTTGDVTLSDTNLVTDTIYIADNDTLSIRNPSFIKLRHHGFITGAGTLVVDSGAIIDSDSWARMLLLAAQSNHPKLVWGDYEVISSITKYRIYRKIGSGSWTNVDSTTQLYWKDNSLSFAEVFGFGVQYKITAVSNTESSGYSNIVSASVTNSHKETTERLETILYEYELSQNYPNPFNPNTTIKYTLKKSGIVTVKVFDILGNEVALLVNEEKAKGEHSVTFDASSLASGIYFYAIRANDFNAVKKMILLK